MVDITIKMFPIAAVPHAKVVQLLTSIPWDMVAPYESQALANHKKTLAELADAGGLTPVELYYLLRNERVPFPAMNTVSLEDAISSLSYKLRKFNDLAVVV